MAQLGDSTVTDHYAIYCGDCIVGMKGLPDESIGFQIRSPPFGGLYNYSSSERDLSNARSYGEFFQHYAFAVWENTRLAQPGRLSAVHVMDVPKGAKSGLRDFPGDVIRVHEGFCDCGHVHAPMRVPGSYRAQCDDCKCSRHRSLWKFHDRKGIWKEPLKAAIRTRALGLRHGQLVKDSAVCHSAHMDQIIVFRKRGENKDPITHEYGLSEYAGDWQAPPRPRAGCGFNLAELQDKYADWQDQKTNKLSHWIWQRYASSFWDDIRIDRVLPYRKARDPEDEKHVHPLQLDVIERCLHLWSNPDDAVLTDFMGVGSEVYGAVTNGRRGIGWELKPTYYRQARQNVEAAFADWKDQDDQRMIPGLMPD